MIPTIQIAKAKARRQRVACRSLGICQAPRTSDPTSQSTGAGVQNYTVTQGDVLNVNFNTNLSTTVIMGGSANGGFAQDAPCEVVGHLGPAPSQPIASNTITGFTFSPSRAVCPSVGF